MPVAWSVNILQRVLAAVAIAFGVATLFAGGRVLLGVDPGYVVYRPLLVFNTAMGAAYLLTGALGWFDAQRGRRGAMAIALLNLAMLAVTSWLFASQADLVARQSVAAMGLRTVVWLALWAGFSRAARR